MSKPLKSPYNFVPASEHVYCPSWAPRVSQDLPFRDGLSGVLECELEARTPVHVGGDRDAPEMPFRLDGQFAIPGSSLRGMIRSVLSVAAYGRLSRLDDVRFSVRDLTPAGKEIYRDRIKKVHAGWLTFGEGKWWLQECEWAQIDQEELGRRNEGVTWEQGMPELSAREKYDAWDASGFGFEFGVEIGPGPGGSPQQQRARLSDAENATPASLVLTGQPSARKPGEPKKKSIEFVFLDPLEHPKLVSPGLMQDFFFVHASQKDPNKLNAELDYLLSESPYWREHGNVPVFFVRDEQGQPRAMGLAYMFRLAYEKTTRQCLPSAHRQTPDPDTASGYDLADLVFGDAFGRNATPFCKGRVSFDHARVVGNPEPLPEKKLVLSSPRPGFYPAYVDQSSAPGGRYLSYSDDKARLRGWKRYPALGERREHPGEGATEEMESTIRFLDSGTRFRFRVRFHNLRPAELGAFIWSLTWGGEAQYVHRLGKAKPYGYGEVAIALVVEESRVRNSTGTYTDPATARDECIAAFEKQMDRFLQRATGKSYEQWRKSDPVKALLAMADPEAGKRYHGSERLLEYYPGPADYTQARSKKESAVLPDFLKRSAASPRR